MCVDPSAAAEAPPPPQREDATCRLVGILFRVTHESVAMLYFWCSVAGDPVTMYSETAGVVGLSKLAPTRYEPLPASGRLFAANHASLCLLALTRFAEDRLLVRERYVPYTHVSVDAVYFIVCNPVPAVSEYVPATTIIESLLWTPKLWPMFAE